MNKKAQIGFLVRLIITIVAFFMFVFFLKDCYGRIAYSDSEKQFNNFVTAVNGLNAGDKKTQSIALDSGGAFIGFSKDSAQIEFQLAGSDKSIMQRPSQCLKDQACLCWCRSGMEGKSKEDTLSGELKTSCTWIMKCSSFKEFDVAQEFFNTYFLYKNGFTQRGGFMIARGSSPYWAALQVSGRTLSLQMARTNDGKTITICDPHVKECGS